MPLITKIFNLTNFTYLFWFYLKSFFKGSEGGRKSSSTNLTVCISTFIWFKTFHFVFLQRWWRCCLVKHSTMDSAEEEEEAAVCLQAAWRSYRERRRFLQWRDSAVVIQRSWRHFCHRRSSAAVTLQTAWRGFVERSRYCRTHRAVTQLQAVGRGHLARLRWVNVICNTFSSNNVLIIMLPDPHGCRNGWIPAVCQSLSFNISVMDLH